MDISQYLGMFIEEAKDHIQSLNDNMLKLEENPGDLQLINEIFRSAHTLKGMAGTMGFVNMQKLTHAMENVLAAARDGKLRINSNIMDVLFKTIDALEEYLDVIVATGTEGSEQNISLVNSLNGILGRPQEEVALKDKTQGAQFEYDEFVIRAIERANSQGFNVYRLDVELDPNCLLKSARAYLVFKAVEELGEIIHSKPSVQDIEDEKFDFEFSITIVSKESLEKIRDRILSISEIREVKGIEIKETSQIAVQAKQEVTEQETGAITETVKVVRDQKQEAAKKTAQTVRVDIERLDVLMNLVSELIIIKSRIEGLTKKYSDRQFEESIEYLERITTSLHDAVMKVRMVPVERVFSRFPRMMRDLARELGKEFELVMSGEDTEVDRTIVDELGDPLIHLLRNAADHGIEDPEERVKNGKPRSGLIKLSAYHDGNNVVIEVEDDGKGIDIEKVRKKAIEKGLLKEDQLDLSDQEIIDLLFLPSFSTKDKVTNLSGRGVGLDVVKTKIEQLGGMVEVKSEKGRGTKFIIRLPLTLAIIQALLVTVADEIYAIPIASIKEIVDVAKEDIKVVQKGKEIILLRNQVIPIKYLHKIVGLEENPDRKKYTVVIVKRGEKLTGIVVDKLLGQQDIVIKSLGKYLEGVRLVSGATILGDGSVAMILDPNVLVV
ncbi:chemotaxis protein CheA [Caldicellulosiruptor morganii]|uniref:Chemotaxis protein CheA n=1 Tax=Caldicellulosiruptor morganii TaxID=1387555 RepID=A0ABY7BQ88_9FIRM|nr:chemotaxis protein CheA [Caldicellulosiruptor morganii]WAM35013.1 chemotaxis protein CheA [Caldicellulosiruptor morganii]